MALKSGGSMPPWRGVVDANQDLAILDTVHHWRATRINKKGGRPGYEVMITHAGKRVRVSRRFFVDAVNAAMEKLKRGIDGGGKLKGFVLKLSRR